MRKILDLSSKTILVTGASAGIGRSIAINCASQGAVLLLTGRSISGLNETLLLLEGNNHSVFQADLSSIEDIERLVNHLPILDGVVCNAGIASPKLLQFYEKNEIDNMINVNAISSINLLRLLTIQRKISKKASVVFISSINGNKCTYIGSTIYAASKSMISGFMKALALELAPKKIRINSIEAGMIKTDLLKNSAISSDDLEIDMAKYPLKRYGTPQDVANLTLFLLSDESEWMTGSNVVLDGGYTLL